MNHFTGIFYGNFVTERHYGIYGPLAVGGTASIPEYSVDVRRLANCSSSDPIERLGLYAKTLASPASLRIYGDLNTGNIPGFLELISENRQCKVSHQLDPNNFKFAEIWPSAIRMSSFLASQVATHVLRTDGSVDEVYHTEDQRFHIFHFGPCDSTGCRAQGDYVSDASRILLGSGNWQGPTNGYPRDRMIVFNASIQRDRVVVATVYSCIVNNNRLL